MKHLFVYVFIIISLVGCDEATEPEPVNNLAICRLDQVFDFGDADELQYVLCKQVSSSTQFEDLRTFCGSVSIITNGSVCSDVVNTSLEYGKCVHNDSTFTLIGDFLLVGATTEEQKNSFLTDQETACEGDGGVWALYSEEE